MEALSGSLLALGAVFMLLGAVGLARYPDVYLRMQATSKASSLGVALMMLGVAIQAGTWEVFGKALLIVTFFFLTSPVAAYVMARAAYYKGTPLWAGTVLDELKPRRDAVQESRDQGPQGG